MSFELDTHQASFYFGTICQKSVKTWLEWDTSYAMRFFVCWM